MGRWVSDQSADSNQLTTVGGRRSRNRLFVWNRWFKRETFLSGTVEYHNCRGFWRGINNVAGTTSIGWYPTGMGGHAANLKTGKGMDVVALALP